MPFSELFRGRKAECARPVEAASTASGTHSLDAAGKLAIIDEIERSGTLAFWATDASGRVVYLSPAIREKLNLSSGHAEGQPLQQLFTPTDGESDGRSLGLKLNIRKSFSNLAIQTGSETCDMVLRISGRPLYDAFAAMLST
jgi:PAS domain-containing protein